MELAATPGAERQFGKYPIRLIQFAQAVLQNRYGGGRMPLSRR